jgi:hypothetical protein
MAESAPTIDTLERQMRETVGAPFTRALEPCPNSGRISFAQIADLKIDRNDVDCNDERLLVTRKMVETDEESEYKGAYYHAHPEPANDPSDYYGAFWGHDYEFQRGENLPVNPIGRWNEAFSDPYPENFTQRGVEVGTSPDNGQPYFRMFAQTDEKLSNGDFKQLATYMTAYIGRVPAGTNLTVYFEYDAGAPNWYDTSTVFELRAWSEGFFQGAEKTYIKRSLRNHGQWNAFKEDFTVDSVHKDLFVAFQKNTSSSRSAYQNHYFRNFQIWRT